MEKMKIKVLFYIRNKKISVYEYKKNRFEAIQDCGEDIIEYNDDFTSWFKNAIAYLKGLQELDYLIITDNSVSLELSESEFDIVNESIWNKDRIREFNIDKLASQGLILKNTLNKEYYSFNVKRNPLEYTVIFCDKKVNKKPKEHKEKKNTKNKAMEPKQNKSKIIVEVKSEEGKHKEKKIKPKTIIIEQEPELSLNKEINITEYYKEKLRKEEEERLKIKPKF